MHLDWHLPYKSIKNHLYRPLVVSHFKKTLETWCWLRLIPLMTQRGTVCDQQNWAWQTCLYSLILEPETLLWARPDCHPWSQPEGPAVLGSLSIWLSTPELLLAQLPFPCFIFCPAAELFSSHNLVIGFLQMPLLLEAVFTFFLCWQNIVIQWLLSSMVRDLYWDCWRPCWQGWRWSNFLLIWLFKRVLNVSEAIAIAKALSLLLLTYFTTAQNGAITQLKSCLHVKPTWVSISLQN